MKVIVCAALAVMSVLLFCRPVSGQCAEWRSVSSASAPAYISCETFYDAASKTCLLIGDIRSDGALDNAIYRWDGSTWKKIAESGSGPKPVKGARAAYDSWRSTIVYFGGIGGDFYEDTWEFNGENWSVVATTGPRSRHHQAMTFDSLRGVTVMNGGDGSATVRDTWEWDGKEWSLRDEFGVPAFQGHSMTFDSRRGVSVMYAGYASNNTYEWDGDTWKKVNTIHTPGSRTGASMSYDAEYGVTLLFGGADNSETWSYDGSDWTMLIDNGPSPVVFAGMSYDSFSHECLLYGGSSDSRTWLLRTGEAFIYEQPQDESVKATHEIEISVDVGVTGGMEKYTWRKDGVILAGDPRMIVDGEGSLFIYPAVLSDTGNYDVVVDTNCGTVISDPALIVVYCSPDCNRDDKLNVNDFLCFQREWRKRTPYGDYDGSGTWTVNDFIAFQKEFVDGCPLH